MNLIKSHKYKLANRFIFEPNSDLLKNIDTNEVIHLGSNESRLLLFLVEHNNEIVSREQLHQYVWRDQGFEVDDSSLTQAISTLRKALNDPTKTPQFIRTMPKRGYRFIAQVDSMANDIDNIAQPEVSTQQNEDEETLKEESIKIDELNRDSETEYNHSSSNSEVEQSITHNTYPASDTNDQPNVHVSQGKRKKSCIFAKPAFYLLWIMIFLMPIAMLMLDDPIKTEFKTLGTINDIPVVQKAILEDLTPWFGEIKTCTTQYLTSLDEDDALYKVIASHTHNDKFTLNFIHKNKPINNHTMIFFINNEDVVNLCS